MKAVKTKDLARYTINELMKAVCEIYDILASNTCILIPNANEERFQKLKNTIDKFREEII